MATLHYFINLTLHLDQHITILLSNYGNWAYVILFLIIFSETGLVILPFLPGDSLLFAIGALAAQSSSNLNIHFLFFLLTLAAILGNILNYAIGRHLGARVFYMPQSWLLNPNYLIKAHRFYETHGAQALITARFMPIIRSFAPFVAGIGYMQIRRFILYNILGALLWVGSLLYSSYLFGNLPFIKEHFSTVILTIIIISLLPPIIGCIKHRKSS